MKKMIFTLAALGIAGAALAQTTFGIKAGPDFSSYAAKYGSSKETSAMIIGLSGGVYANLPIAPEFYIQPSLMYEGKGGKEKELDTKARLRYLTLPVNLLFKPEMQDGKGSWIIGAGGYIGYGLSGKVTTGINDSTSVFSFSSNPFDKGNFSDAKLKRFDVGADIQLGYEISSGINIRLNAELGLINTLSNQYSNQSLHNISFSAMVGYAFGKH